MTRLTPELLEKIPGSLPEYDGELKAKTGATLLEIAKTATGCGVNIEKVLRRSSSAVVPVTAGMGVIKGFTDAVTAVLQHLGLKAFTTEGTDVKGFAEALAEGSNLIFAADDEVFAAFNPRSMKVVHNSVATGWAYAAALELRAQGLNGKPVSVIGVGQVGYSAVEYLTHKGAHAYIFDVNRSRSAYVKRVYGERVSICESVGECFKHAKLCVLAAPATNLIHESLVDEDTVIAAPAIPLGLTKGALRKLPWRNLIHDPLQLGVAAMAVEALKR